MAVALVLVVVYPPRNIAKQMHVKVLAWLEQRWADSMIHIAPTATPDAQWLVSAQSSELLHYLTFRRKQFPFLSGAIVDSDLREQTLALIAKWPNELQAYMRQRVRQILIVRNLGSSGYMLTADNQHFTILIDASVLGMTPNEWFRMKEGTIVNTEATGHQLLHRIEADSADVPERLLEGIIMHELAHCIGISEGHTTDVKGRVEGLPPGLVIFDGAFRLPAARPQMREELRERFPMLHYYGQQERIPVSEYAAMLDRLRDSEFPSLYATVSDLEFFAEYLYTFVHCVKQGRPLEYLVTNGTDTMAYLPSPILSERNADRAAMMEQVLQDLAARYDMNEHTP
jgi:hypothetical protein